MSRISCIIGEYYCAKSIPISVLNNTLSSHKAFGGQNQLSKGTAMLRFCRVLLRGSVFRALPRRNCAFLGHCVS